MQELSTDNATQGIRSVAITAVFAPIDFTHKQEERVAELVRQFLPDVYITISKRVANAGLLARENATVLNASLARYAASTVRGFRTAVKAMGLACPVFVTSNDGCLMTLEAAANFPIRTFSSGPTNSMRGAAFLATLASGKQRKETALVMDIGGTTVSPIRPLNCSVKLTWKQTEVGVILPSGFPRQAANQHYFCGVRLNFDMPHVTSIGLGGGSIVEEGSNDKVTVGPNSVGYRLITEAKVFGGNTLTATDVCVASGAAPSSIGKRELVVDLDQHTIDGFVERTRAMIERTVDSMKTSPAVSDE